jgi:hypothetical protein
MKKFIIILIVLTGCVNKNYIREKISLAGEWKFRIDSLDQGINDKWYSTVFEDSVSLPGSMATNGKGDEVKVNTDWTGDIVDRSWFTDKKYEKYRQPGNIKLPFWLKPVTYYKGPAWYQKEFALPERWAGKRVVLSLERCHWESTVFVNDKNAGTQNSLSTPHRYDITGLLVPGKNTLSIRIDNRIKIPIGVNSHSISDHTQTNWNGIIGEISLQTLSDVFIDEIRIFPEVQKSSAKLIITIRNPQNRDFRGKLVVRCAGSKQGNSIPEKIVTIATKSDKQEVMVDFKIPKAFLWSEFTPDFYRMTSDLIENHKIIDSQSADFGMREFKINGTRFEVNGHPVFLRGTLECCIFPLTGFPPTDVKSWEKVLRIFRDYGLNHVRFHSWCPPEAAFIAADKLGFYFHIECSSWANGNTTIGDGSTVDKFIYDEGDRIIREYGNHPSFCMLAYGNEPGGKNQNEYLGKLISYWKAEDDRRVYTSGAGWPVIPENDYNVTSDPRIQHWGEGLGSIINAKTPQSIFDYCNIISQYKVPTVSHEIGQWCVYPDFREIPEYTGVLKPTNLEIFRETLEENKMGDQAQDFLMASGKLQALCYKAEIEAALRTPGFAGFQLLQLHDFPGQGTALVGILNPFLENKGYITPEEFRMFCNETVPLARMEKMTWRNDELFKAAIEIAHFGEKPLGHSSIVCRIIGSKGDTIQKQEFPKDITETGNCIPVGSFSFGLSRISQAEKLTLDVSVENTGFKNRWDFWVYSEAKIDPGKVFVTDRLDKATEDILHKGGSVLLLTYGKVGKTKGAQVAIGFSSIFWNTAWTNNQPPHTLGILCDPKHPLFRDFPTEYHSNWQWWDPVMHSQVMIMTNLPAGLKPLIQPIDTWFENRKLALAFETKTGGGKLLVCSIDLKDFPEDRIVSKQLLGSIYKYMNSNDFNPAVKVELNEIRQLISE